jgi:hypothetical protein
MNQLKGFLAAIRAILAREFDIGLNLGERYLHRFRQQSYVFVGAFDVVERSLGAMAHLQISSRFKSTGSVQVL